MSKTGVRLDIAERELFLELGGSARHPTQWLVTIVDRGNHIPFIMRGSQKPEEIAREIEQDLYKICSSNWVDYQFPETKKIIVALIEEVQSFDRLIAELKLPDDKMRDAFLDVSGGLRLDIQASMFQLLKRRRPAAAELVLEGFRRIGEDTPAWAEPVSSPS